MSEPATDSSPSPAPSAAERLGAWLHTEVLSQEDAAERLGCHQTTLSKILRGGQLPSLRVAVAIAAATADVDGGPILPDDWVEAPT